jgi:Arc/MetJ-type ribon-helix-helix transcriptional regulator
MSCMAGTQTTLRLDPRIKDTIDRLVEEGRYPSMTAFIVEAILLKLDVEGIAVDGMEPEPDALERYFASPAGERLLSRLIRQELEAIQMAPRTVSHPDDPS